MTARFPILMLAAALLAICISCATGFAADSPPGPIAYWKFDEGSGTTAYDSSGNAHHGALLDGAAYGPGLSATALALSDLDDRVRVEDDGALSGFENLSVSCWFKPIGFASLDLVTKEVQLGTDGKNTCFALRIAPSMIPEDRLLQAEISAGPGDSVKVHSLAYRLGPQFQSRWYHAAFTYDQSTLRLYMDGLQVATASYDKPLRYNRSVPLVIGGRCFYSALIDEVKIYDRARTPQEIAREANRLVAYWKFDEGSGTTAYDSSGNGYHGTILGGRYEPGVSGTALAFYDPYSTVWVDDDGNIGGFRNLSVCCWFKPEKPCYQLPFTLVGRENQLVGEGVSTDCFSLRVSRDPPQPGEPVNYRLEAEIVGHPIDAPIAVAASDLGELQNRWYHAALTYDQSTLRLYLDGLQLATASYGMPLRQNPSRPLGIGFLNYSPYGPPVSPKSLIDEVKIYDRALPVIIPTPRPSPDIRVTSASGYPGQQDVPVMVWTQDPFAFAGCLLTLSFGTDVLEQPEPEDVTTTLDGLFEVNTEIDGQLSLILVTDSDIHVPPRSPLATVRFDVQDYPLASSTPLTLTDALFVDENLDEVHVIVGPPGTFTVIQGIIPSDPTVSVGDYLHFTLAGPHIAVPHMWDIFSASGGTIHGISGLYHAGHSGGVDEILLFLEGGTVFSTEVTVTEEPRPAGEIGPPTSMDLTGGGVSVDDAILMLQALVGIKNLSPEELAAADFNLNGRLDLADVLNALRIIVGLDPII